MGILTFQRISGLFLKFCIVFLILEINVSFGQSKKVIISEVNYQSDSTLDSGDWIELYNNSDETIDLSGWVFTDIALNQFFKIPQGTVILARDYYIVCQDSDLFTREFPEIKKYVGSFVWSIKHKKETLNLFDSQNNLDFTFSFVDSLPWPKCADGYGRTMELKDINGNFNDGNNWFSGCIGGSPGRAFSACKEEIIFSEINYNSSSTLDVGDWVEIRNISGNEIDLSGWKLVDKKDSAHFFIPTNTIIQPGENYVFVKKFDAFKMAYPNVSHVFGSFTFSLGSDGDVLKLYNEKGKLVYSVYYNSVAPWPFDAMKTGKTLELVDSSKNASDGTNWISGCYGGSPGSYYSSNCILGIDKTNSSTAFALFYPNPVKTNFFIEFNTENWLNTEAVTVMIYDALGLVVEKHKQVFFDQKSNDHKIEISVGALTTGIYFYQVMQKNQPIASGKFLVNQQ